MAADKTTTRDFFINGEQAVSALKELQDEAKELKAKMKSAEEGTKEYEKTSKELDKVKIRINKVKKEVDALDASQNTATASMKKLKEAARVFTKQLDNAEQGTKKFAQASQNLQKVNTQISKIREQTKALPKEQEKVTSAFDKSLKFIINLMSKAGVALAAFFALEKILEFARGIDETSRKVIELRKNIATLTGLSGKELDETTIKVKSLTDTFGKDYNEVLAASNALAQTYGISQTKALSLIEKGLIKGADAQGDFLDKLKEYPVQFREAGIGAESFIKFATQEVQGGVFGDKLLDSVKELGLRMRELAPAQKAALEPLGESFSRDLIDKVRTGQTSIVDAFIAIRERGKEVGLGVQEIQTIIADLGGGPLEDLGGVEEAFRQMDAAQKLNLNTLTEQEKAQKSLLDAQNELAAVQNEIAKEYEEIARQSDLARLSFQSFVLKGVLFIFKNFKAFRAQVSSFFEPVIKRIRELGKRLTVTGEIVDSIKELFANLFALFVTRIKGAISIGGTLIDLLISIYDNSKILQTIFRGIGETIILAFKNGASTIKIATDATADILSILQSIITLDFQGFLSSSFSLFSNFSKNVLGVFSNVKEAIEDTFNTAASQKRAEERRLEEIKKAQEEEERLRQEDLQRRREASKKNLDTYLESRKKEQEKGKEIDQQAANERLAKAREIQEKLEKQREEFEKKKLAAERALEDLRNSLIEDEFDREIAQLKTKHARELEEIEAQGIRVEEFKALKADELNQKLAEIEEKRKEAAKEKREEEFEAEFEKIAEEEELKREQEEERFLLAQETELQRDLERLTLREEALKAELELKKNYGKLTEAEEQRLNNEILKTQIEQAKKEEEVEKKTTEAKAKIRELGYQNFKNLTGLLVGLFGESKKAQKASLVADAGFAIADVIINAQKAIAAYRASVAAIPFGIGAALAAAYATQTKIQAGISIATIVAQKAKEFKHGGQLPEMVPQIISMARGGFLEGPSHSAGGMRIEGTNIEVEGGEFVTNHLSTARNLPVLEAINAHPNTTFEIVRKYQDGGQLPGGSPAVDPNSNLIEEGSQENQKSILIQKMNEVLEMGKALISKIDEKSDSFKEVVARVDPFELEEEKQKIAKRQNEASSRR